MTSGIQFFTEQRLSFNVFESNFLNLDCTLIEKEKLKIKEEIKTNPDFAFFQFLPDSFFHFLYGEKNRLSMIPETRRVWDEQKLVSGYTHHYNCEEDQYHPKHFRPFELKGFWIPEEEGFFFSSQEMNDCCPLIRINNGKREILFFIHPKSENFFSSIIKKYAHNQIRAFALSLSSFRTLLVAIPKINCIRPDYVMIKVSLDAEIGGVSRILSLKECAGSVAATAILQKKSSKIEFMQDSFSFVLNTENQKKAGMIYRAIPDRLSNQYVVPLFSLFGSKNKDLLDFIIQKSGQNPTECIVNKILKPIAEGFIDLLYFHHVSIEIHGQNLLLVIDISNPNDLKIELIYRDMGGVNCFLSEKNKQLLPKTLNQKDFFYCDSHVKDAAKVLEDITKKVLFNLTKQFVKSEDYVLKDPSFALWKSEVMKRGFIENWTVMGENNDLHKIDFSVQSFYRYGYFEKIFGKLILNELTRKGIFIAISDYNKELNYEYFLNKLENPQNPYNTCVEIEWFKELILQTYPLFSAIEFDISFTKKDN